MPAEPTYKKLRIFIASPSDVAAERAKVGTAAAALKPLADFIGVALETLDWRKALPDMGRPQQAIFDQLKPTSWDVFIGILWQRFGTPPGGADPQTQKEYLSGTEEEFWTAYRLWEKYRRPRMMIYRCTRAVSPETLDPDQFKRVKEFFAEFDAVKGAHPGLYQSYDTPEAFEKLLLDHLQKLLLSYSEEEKRQTLSPQTLEALAPPKIPDTLPRRDPFFGRKKEIADCRRALGPQDRGWGIIIDGIGGIGKTALAVEVAYLCKAESQFEAFIFASAKQTRLDPEGVKSRNAAVRTLEGFLNETARGLGQPGIAQLTGEEKRRALLDALRQKPALLIYDNLETLEKAEQEALADFLRDLPQSCKAIITSRRRGGEGAAWLRLEQLDWESGRAIIADEMSRDARLAETLRRAGEAQWRLLFDETGGSPLALKHVLGLMRVRGPALTLERALALLRKGAGGEADLQQFIYREARKELGENEIKALGALSFFLPSAAFEALMATADLSRTALEVVLERLDALSLVNREAGEERYSLHPLTRRYVRDELLAEPKTAADTGMRFAKYWLDYANRYGGSSKNYPTFPRLEAEWPNVEAAASYLWELAALRGEAAGDGEAARMLNDLVDALSQWLWFGGRWDERVQWSARAYPAAAARKDWSEAGWRAYQAAWIYYQRARTEEAAEWTGRCAEAWARGGSKSDQAEVGRMRGLVAQQRKEYAEAERLLREALAAWRESGEDEDVAIVLNDLGALARKREDYEAAERFYREALELVQKQNLKEPQAYISGNLGTLALVREQWAEARRRFEQELPLAEEVGRVDLIAHAKAGLARALEAEGRPGLALPLAQEALAIYQRLQHSALTATQALVERLRGAAQKSGEEKP